MNKNETFTFFHLDKNIALNPKVYVGFINSGIHTFAIVVFTGNLIDVLITMMRPSKTSIEGKVLSLHCHWKLTQ